MCDVTDQLGQLKQQITLRMGQMTLSEKSFKCVECVEYFCNFSQTIHLVTN